MARSVVNNELEIRKLPSRAMYCLSQMLEHGSDWKKLMAIIPKNRAEEPYNAKYKYEHFKLIEQASDHQRRPCAEIFLEEWITSGRQQPNLTILLQLLLKAELFRAAEYVAIELLNEPAPERPTSGIAADVDISEEAIKKILTLKAENTKSLEESRVPIPFEKVQMVDTCQVPVIQVEGESSYLRNSDIILQSEEIHLEHQERDESQNIEEQQETSQRENFYPVANNTQSTFLLNQYTSRSVDEPSLYRCTYNATRSSSPTLQLNTRFPQFHYSELERITANFCEDPVSQHGPLDGRKLGTGAFGSVYLGFSLSKQVAVKRLKRDVINVEKQFMNEVEALSKYQHRHLLNLVGYSCDGPAYCLVYEYMQNGSLQERLACQGSTPVLLWQKRLEIALGTSQGILYLHTAYEKPLIHRDIKSANILLDHEFVPKLGDFGLVRLGASGQQSQSVALTSTVFGTSAYMAPEAFRGDISIKLDSFSFGVVILELLTSLPPYDEKREGCDLVTHVEDICEGSIEPLLDRNAGTWGKSDVLQPSEVFYGVALDCLREKRHRPNMDVVVEHVQAILMACR